MGEEVKEKIKAYYVANDIDEIIDCITNLQEKLKVSQTNEETYRLEMQDITKILRLDEHTIFDEVKEYATNLQEENEKLKELCNKYEEEHSTAFKLWTMKMEEMPCYEEFMNYKSRNEKATTYYYKTLSQYNNQNKKMPDEAVEMFNLLENNK